jgi:hypothetical protein
MMLKLGYDPDDKMLVNEMDDGYYSMILVDNIWYAGYLADNTNFELIFCTPNTRNAVKRYIDIAEGRGADFESMFPDEQSILKLNRDSVCMGDDAEARLKIVPGVPEGNLAESVMGIAKWYLPKVAGNHHWWDCILNGASCATIYGNCDRIVPKYQTRVPLEGSLYFKYHWKKQG